ncbi:hypothetical protein NE237_017310 [Protea cynaroides]|uniref:Uncharacterized protein n=1 Tax=Protea cynaroides TaxID=273540 RepID=A0A9Q0K7V8_9MAGN|nr:hypothetical protein NE237_017310 [Protea cynaroides]
MVVLDGETSNHNEVEQVVQTAANEGILVQQVQEGCGDVSDREEGEIQPLQDVQDGVGDVRVNVEGTSASPLNGTSLPGINVENKDMARSVGRESNSPRIDQVNVSKGRITVAFNDVRAMDDALERDDAGFIEVQRRTLGRNAKRGKKVEVASSSRVTKQETSRQKVSK